MKLRLHSHHRSLLAGLLALCLALAALAGFAAQASAASSSAQQNRGGVVPVTTPPLPGFTIPADEGVAIAQIATVRIVADYSFMFTVSPNPEPQTLHGFCTGLGVLLQSSTASDNTPGIYLLTTNALLNQTNACGDASQAISAVLAKKKGSKLLSIGFSRADVYLSTAYSGADQPAIKLQIKGVSALMPTLTTDAALMVAFATPVNGGKFPHDYPTVTLASGPGTTGQVIDLTSSSGMPLTSQALNSVPLSSTDPGQYLTPAPATSLSTASVDTSQGAPVVDRQGALVGLVNNNAGNRSLIPPMGQVAGQVNTLPNAATSCPGPSNTPTTSCLSYQWQQEMNKFYPVMLGKDEKPAMTAIAGLASAYPDFKGASDFATAIQLPTPTKTVTPQPTASGTGNSSGLPGFFKNLTGAEIFGLIVLIVLLILVFIMTLLISVRRMRRKSERAQPAPAGAFPTRTSRPSGQVEPSYGLPPGGSAAASYPPVAAPNGLPRRTIVCPRCGMQNNLGASNCANCGTDLPQGVAGTSGVGQSFGRSTSGSPLPLNLPTLNPPPALAPDIAEMPTQVYQNQGASNAELERTLPTMPAVGSVRQDEATVVMRRRQPLGIKVSTKSDVGRRRAGKANEDNFLAVTGTWKHNGQLQPFGVFVIADGMGGHANGQDASRMAVETIYQHLTETLPQQDIPEENLGEFLQQAIQRANQMIYQQNQKDHADMGCTMTAALVTGNEAHICNVGDSRTYVLTPHDHLQRVTTDHSIVQSLVDAGVIQKDDVYTHPKRNQIYRSLGEKEAQDIDLYRQRLAPGDKLLLCCDGLWEMIRDPEIEQTMRQDDLPQVTNKLIEMANENGGVDNITAIVVRVMEDSKPAKQPKIESVASGPARLDQQH